MRRSGRCTRAAGRLSGRRHNTLAGLMPMYGISAAGTLDAAALFGADLPLVVEIGSGMGEATVEMLAPTRAAATLAVEILTSVLGLISSRPHWAARDPDRRLGPGAMWHVPADRVAFRACRLGRLLLRFAFAAVLGVASALGHHLEWSTGGVRFDQRQDRRP
jgi:hypothetical protein